MKLSLIKLNEGLSTSPGSHLGAIELQRDRSKADMQADKTALEAYKSTTIFKKQVLKVCPERLHQLTRKCRQYLI